MKEKVNLINADAFKELKKIKSNSVDLILTDVPYNISKYAKTDVFIGNRRLNTKIAKWDGNYFDPSLLVDDFKRILKPTGNIFVFTSYNQIGLWHKYFDNEFDTFQFMVWHKTNPAPCVYKKTFLNSCELIICLWNKGHKWNFISQERLVNPKHPTQKPVSVLEHIIKIASNENDVVLDPFMGVGSTGVACKNLNRNFIGIEINKEYFEAASNRIL